MPNQTILRYPALEWWFGVILKITSLQHCPESTAAVTEVNKSPD